VDLKGAPPSGFAGRQQIKTPGVHASFGSWHLNAITAGKSPVIAHATPEAVQTLLILGDSFVP
jgi:hypothetical protein